jgi:hypothetical protein
MSPLLAQSGHHDRAEPCLLSGVKRTFVGSASQGCQTRLAQGRNQADRLPQEKNFDEGEGRAGSFVLKTDFFVSYKIEARLLWNLYAHFCNARR